MKLESPEMDRVIESHMRNQRIAGLSACRLQGGELIWARGYGWADIAAHKPMTPDTILNIGSISKTFTCTALMQLWEKRMFQLDDPVNEALPFRVRHPRHSGPITIRQLLTHTSAIDDGPAYPASYTCGDPTISLGDWLQDYLVPGGKYYDAECNFKPYAPGAGWSYSNVAFGLLGFVVEQLSGEPFHLYCRAHIFEPLGMNNSGWLLSEVDLETHAVPYALPEMPHLSSLHAKSPAPGSQTHGSQPHIPLCLYSFPNYPDGLVRTSARQLARYAAAFAAQGKRQGGPVLSAAAVQRCFTQEWPPAGSATASSEEEDSLRGLAWGSRLLPNGSRIWGHDGGDPGINSRLAVRPADGAAIIILANTNHTRESMERLADTLWEAG